MALSLNELRATFPEWSWDVDESLDYIGERTLPTGDTAEAHIFYSPETSKWVIVFYIDGVRISADDLPPNWELELRMLPDREHVAVLGED